MDKKTRSRIMSSIKGKNTKPEIKVRRYLHSLGFRFCLHKKELSGKPDVVLPKYKTCVFVNGCFWHSHNCRKGKRKVKTNKAFWENKFLKNRERDRRNRRKLRNQGWKVVTIWECQIDKPKFLDKMVSKILE